MTNCMYHKKEEAYLIIINLLSAIIADNRFKLGGISITTNLVKEGGLYLNLRDKQMRTDLIYDIATIIINMLFSKKEDDVTVLLTVIKDGFNSNQAEIPIEYVITRFRFYRMENEYEIKFSISTMNKIGESLLVKSQPLYLKSEN